MEFGVFSRITNVVAKNPHVTTGADLSVINQLGGCKRGVAVGLHDSTRRDMQLFGADVEIGFTVRSAVERDFTVDAQRNISLFTGEVFQIDSDTIFIGHQAYFIGVHAA
ncbi:Uncharacterised protein [Serratia proteamaculans]|nr:Uncharacterised protein [Serratia proteamaculans]